MAPDRVNLSLDLSQPQVTVLVLWRISIVLAQGCGLTAVAIMLAYLLDRGERTMQQTIPGR